MCTKWEEINSNLCFLASQKAGLRTPCVWKMLIIPPPLATALHRSGHMLLYKLFTYNGTLYGAATRLFQNSDQTPRFPPTPGQKKESVWTQKASACHIIYCAWQGREVKDAVDPSHCCCDINRFTNSHRLYMN